MKKLVEKLVRIQNKLKAPKNQYNSFGKYHYRNAEDILEAVKPLLLEEGVALTITDEVIQSHHEQSEPYIKATCYLTDGESTITASAVAREAIEQKGMGSSQISGSTSSYARKYCLNGMFLIDDTKDDDFNNTHDKSEKKAVKKVESIADDKSASETAPVEKKRFGGFRSKVKGSE